MPPKTLGPLKTEVTVTLARYTSNQGPGGMNLRIQDGSSGLLIMEANFEGAAALDLFTAHVTRTQAELYPTQAKFWGMKQELLQVTIPLPKDKFGRGDVESAYAVDRALAENPGWASGSYQRKWNSHRLTKGGYSVTLHRFVPQDPVDPPAERS